MPSRQQLAADLCIGRKTAALQVLQLNRPLVVVELTHQILSVANMRPAQERIGLHLHGALSLRHSLAVVLRRVGVRQIGRIRRRRLFLDLQKQRIARPISLEVDAIVAQPHRSGAHHFERHIHRPVERQQMLPLRLQHLPVRHPARPAPPSATAPLTRVSVGFTSLKRLPACCFSPFFFAAFFPVTAAFATGSVSCSSAYCGVARSAFSSAA